jgi:hypothetical protein
VRRFRLLAAAGWKHDGSKKKVILQQRLGLSAIFTNYFLVLRHWNGVTDRGFRYLAPGRNVGQHPGPTCAGSKRIRPEAPENIHIHTVDILLFCLLFFRVHIIFIFAFFNVENPRCFLQPIFDAKI